MTKVIEKGNVKTAIVICPICSSLLEYENADLEEIFHDNRNCAYLKDYSTYKLVCPVCKSKIDAHYINY